MQLDHICGLIAHGGQSWGGEDVLPMQVRDFLCCALTGQIMEDPVVAAGHMSAERAVEEWLRTHDQSPVTTVSLPHKLLVVNQVLPNTITDFLGDRQREQKKR